MTMYMFGREASGWFGIAVVMMALASIASADDAGEASAPQPQPLGEVSFPAERTVVWMGSPRVVSFSLGAAADTGRAGEATVEDPAIAKVTRPPQVLAGHEVGYLRLEPLAAGTTSLRIGDAEMKLEVRPSPAPVLAEAQRPIIMAPINGAAVWGEIGVAADLFVGPLVDDQPLDVWLEMPGGARIEPVEQTDPGDGPTRRFTFSADLTSMQPGAVELVVMARFGDGQPLQSRAVRVHVVDARGDRVTYGEAESQIKTPRPEGYSDQPLRIGKSETASGGQYVNNAGSRPELAVPFEAQAPGWYQFVAVTAGDPGGGVLPTIGLRIDNRDVRTASRIPGRGWHRVAVGRPVHVEAGEHTAILYFENDFNGGSGRDRNLRIDRYEIVRFDERPGAGERRLLDAPLEQRKLIVALDPALHDSVIGGDVRIDTRCWWDEQLQRDPPRVTLWVNGEPFVSQSAPQPNFDLPVAALRTGANTLRLEAALNDGTAARSPTITVHTPAHPARAGDASTDPRPTRRFALADPAWQDAGALDHRRRDGAERFKSFTSNGSVRMRVPGELRGAYNVYVEARGEQFQGPPLATVRYGKGGAFEPVGEAKADNRFRTHHVGRVELSGGDEAIEVAFTNDKYEKDKGDRNLYVRAVELRPIRGKDAAAPRVELLYPEPDAKVSGVDAVIAELSDDRELDWVELLIDDEPVGMRQTIRASGDGRVLLPLLLRQVDAGEHRVAVRVADRGGNLAESEPQVIYVAHEAPSEPTRYERAVQLLNRFAFGPEPRQLMAVLLDGERAYLEDQLAVGWDDPGERLAWAQAVAAFPQDGNGYHVINRAIYHATLTPNPARQRVVLFVNNHFNTWLRKARPERKAAEYERFVRLGPAPFEHLLRASATSPAMMFYLDQHRSFGKRLNENYAREIMELHTVGVDAGYTQQDVTELASLLTGWRCASTASADGWHGYIGHVFRFDPKLHDATPRTVFGMRFDRSVDEQSYDRVALAVEMLAAHPQTARHIAAKLAEHYTAVPAPKALVDRLAQTYHETGGDVAAMVLEISRHPAAMGPRRAPRFDHPLDYAVRLDRAIGRGHSHRIHGYLNRSGNGMFDRETPDGYPEEDVAYADTNVTLQRWRLAQEYRGDLYYRALDGSIRRPPGGEDADLGAWRDTVIDTIAVRLTGRLLSDRSHEAARTVLTQMQQQGDEGVRLAAAFIAQLPEATMR